MSLQWVATYPGVPPESAFALTGGLGTPIVIDSTSGLAYYRHPDNGVQPLGDGWSYVLLSVEEEVGSATPAATSLVFAPEAGKTYAVEAHLLLETTNATIGPCPGVSWPTGLSVGAVALRGPDSSGAELVQYASIAADDRLECPGLPSANEEYLFSLAGILVAGGSPSGNFAVTLSTEV